MRPFIIAANWKMNKSLDDVGPFFQALTQQLSGAASELVVIFPTPILCQSVHHHLPKKSFYEWGGQNCHFEISGAFTGETSADALKKMGATWVLVGHSERRTLFGETDGNLARKMSTAQKMGLKPMLCVGETLKERDDNETHSVIERQVRAGLSQMNPSVDLAIAYEPVWAIGTGRVATVEQVADAHKVLRKILRDLWNKEGDRIPILYGGSVTAQNCGELSAIADVDGFLVGGASLKAETFAPIILGCSKRPSPPIQA